VTISGATVRPEPTTSSGTSTNNNTTNGNTANNNNTTSSNAQNANGSLTVDTGTATINTPTLDQTKCPKKSNGTTSTTYTEGILKGVPCVGAINSLSEVLTVIKNIVMDFLLPIVGTLFFIMLLIGGILYITSRGNQQQLDRAKKTLTAAIIGLLIVILSYTIIAIFAGVIGGGIS
jgi:cbb3-type cytochrome oxidase subunit 3